MVKKLLFILLVTASLSSYSQIGERHPIRIYGKVVDARQLPVSYAHIVNTTTLAGCVSDYEGHFNIGAFPGDTFLISAVSYSRKQFILADTVRSGKEFFFILDLDTIMLSEVEVYARQNYLEENKYEVSELARREVFTGLQQATPSYKELVRKHFDISNFQLSMPGPFSLLYSAFSKEAKTRKALENIILQEKVEARYNADLISQITGMHDRSLINRLIGFCDLKPQFIFSSNDYELYSAILRCYKDFIFQGEN